MYEGLFSFFWRTPENLSHTGLTFKHKMENSKCCRVWCHYVCNAEVTADLRWKSNFDIIFPISSRWPPSGKNVVTIWRNFYMAFPILFYVYCAQSRWKFVELCLSSFSVVAQSQTFLTRVFVQSTKNERGFWPITRFLLLAGGLVPSRFVYF